MVIILGNPTLRFGSGTTVTIVSTGGFLTINA